MLNLKSYIGCKIIIHDDDSGEIIAQTLVLEADNKTQSISVESQIFGNFEYKMVSLLVLLDTAVYECKGSAHKTSNSDLAEIAIFQSHEKEDRTSRRYDVNASARIEEYVISNRIIPIPHPLEVTVKNISVDGVLLKGGIGMLNIGTIFQLKLMVGDNITVINTTVLRIDNITIESADYGCKFNFLYDPK